MPKTPIEALSQIQRRQTPQIPKTFLAVLAQLYPKDWDWYDVVVLPIVKERPVSQTNIRFVEKGAPETPKREVIEHAVFALNRTQITLGHAPALYTEKRSTRYTKRVGLASVLPPKGAGPHFVHGRRSAQNPRMRSNKPRKQNIGHIQSVARAVQLIRGSV